MLEMKAFSGLVDLATLTIPFMQKLLKDKNFMNL